MEDKPFDTVYGKHYRVYAKSDIPSRAELLREALQIAEEKGKHETHLMFIPCVFTLQIHGWGINLKHPVLRKLTDLVEAGQTGRAKALEKTPAFRNALGWIRKTAMSWTDRERKIDSELGGKWHYDIRIQKVTSPTWFGATLFNAPWLGEPGHKVQGTVKGFEILTAKGKKLHEQVRLEAQAKPERVGEQEWMRTQGVFYPGEGGTLAIRHVPSFMVLLELREPAVLHRRDLDFFDITLIGKKLQGRYFDRLVERELSEEEKAKYQKGESVREHFWYWWKAKEEEQFSEKLMYQVFSGKIKLQPRKI